MKLNVKLALYISVLAFLCAGLISAFSYQEMRKSIEQDIHTTITSLVDTVYNTAAAAVYVENQELAQEVISGLQKNDIIRCVEIHLFASGETIPSEPPCEGQISVETTLLSPFDKDEELGSIKVYKDTNIIKTKTTERALHEAKTIALIIVITVVLVFFITYLLITKPVEILSKKLQGIDFSQANVTLSESTRSDEIGAIGRVLNTLFSNATSQIRREKLLVLQTQLLTNNFKMTFELSKSPLAVIDKDFALISFNAAFRHLFVEDMDTTDSSFVNHWLEWMVTTPKACWKH